MKHLRTARSTAALDATAPAGVRFCDRCASVSTAAARAAAHRERAVEHVLRQGPRG